jgi:hypothetical protein
LAFVGASPISILHVMVILVETKASCRACSAERIECARGFFANWTVAIQVMKAHTAHNNWKEYCVDGVLITMVVGSVLGLVLIYIH